MKKLHLLALLLLSITFSCGKSSPQKSSLVKQDVSAIYSATEVRVKVFYEEAATPYTGNVATFYLWDLLQKNLEALFQGRSNAPSINVPKNLSEMQKLDSLNKSQWTVEDVLSLAKTVETTNSANISAFNIFFLKGHYKENANVIGFHISGTKTIAMFKDVIESSGNTLVTKYVEQATLIHEMGHALGLVNNGLPMQSSHQDSEHGAHCTNQNCVMYWANEGMSSMMTFAQSAAQNYSIIMFDKQCLNDAQKY